MKGADAWYDIIDKADRLHVGDLRRTSCCGCGYGFKYKNVIFILSEHARGKCFRIWIYENENITDVLNNSHLEVYGITGGQSGWTETYGWLAEGSWVKVINEYLEQLKEKIYCEEHKEEILHNQAVAKQKELYENKAKKFDKIFENLYDKNEEVKDGYYNREYS